MSNFSKQIFENSSTNTPGDDVVNIKQCCKTKTCSRNCRHSRKRADICQHFDTILYCGRPVLGRQRMAGPIGPLPFRPLAAERRPVAGARRRDSAFRQAPPFFSVVQALHVFVKKRTCTRTCRFSKNVHRFWQNSKRFRRISPDKHILQPFESTFETLHFVIRS